MRSQRSAQNYKNKRAHKKYRRNQFHFSMSRHPVAKGLLALASASMVVFASGPSYAATTSVPQISNYSINASTHQITITGSNFGSSSNTSDTLNISGAVATIDSWSNNQIVASVPANTRPGTLVVTTSQGSSNSLTFSGISQGYYSLTPNGTVSVHGNVQFYGDVSTKGISSSSPAVQIVPTADYGGYWILTKSGHIYSFGNAASLNATASSITAVSMAVNAKGTGGYILGSQGQIYPLGNQSSYGAPSKPIAAAHIALTPDGQGYWILSKSGSVYSFGDATNYGNATPTSMPTTYPEGSLVRVGNTPAVFIVLHGTLHHIPNVQTFLGMGLHWRNIHSVPSLAQYSLGSPLVVPFTSGTVLRAQGQSTVYSVMNGIMRPIPTATIFHGMGLHFSQVTVVPSIGSKWPIGPALTQSTPYYPSGSLILVKGSHTVYMVDNGTLRPVPSASLFTAMGYHWSQLQRVASLPNLPVGSPLSTPARAYPTGTLIKAQNNSAVYLNQSGNLRHVPNPQALYTLGYTFSNVVTVANLNAFTMGTTLESTSVPAGSGSSSSTSLAQAVTLSPTQNGQGYWILMSNGQVQTLGNATSYGNVSSSQLGLNSAIAMTLSPDQQGYDILTSGGKVLQFGDAYASGDPATSNDIAISPLPKGNFVSMSYGFFAPKGPSIQTVQNNGAQLSVVNPTWFTVRSSSSPAWSVEPWSSYVSSSLINNLVQTAHAHHVLVMPSIGYSYNPSQSAITSSAHQQSLVQQIVALVKQDHLDGITIDFENSGTGSESLSQASQQYTAFVQQLGAALHANGKKLMVDVYASPYPNNLYNWTAFQSSVDWINVMSYPEHSYSSPPGPTEGYFWLTHFIIPGIINSGVSPQKIILGVAPYGHSWTYSNANGYQSDNTMGNSTIQSYIQTNHITPTWDPWAKALFFTTGTQATAPTAPLSYDVSSSKPSVQNLQGILNIVLLDYAISHNGSRPVFLWTDGIYGSYTQGAVQQFQQEFHVTGDTPGVYGTATATALQKAISQYNVGSTQYWDESSRSVADIVKVAQANHFAGIDNWRMPFETQGYWNALAQLTSVTHY